MTLFLSGAAKGHRMHLRRTPEFLRVITTLTHFKALDKHSDEVKAGQSITVYRLASQGEEYRMEADEGEKLPARMRGVFVSVEHVLHEEQPPEATLTSNLAWRQWCISQGAAE